jgi:hypothetical protein
MCITQKLSSVEICRDGYQDSFLNISGGLNSTNKTHRHNMYNLSEVLSKTLSYHIDGAHVLALVQPHRDPSNPPVSRLV